MKFFRQSLLMIFFVGLSTLSAEEKTPKIELVEVTSSELSRAIESYKGKVVVVDIWASYCLPCLKKFPMLVKLHQELASEGLVILSVTIDDKENADKALAFLTKAGATFRNLHLIDSEENLDKYQAMLSTNAPPIVHVFDRAGKKKSFETGIKEPEVEKYVREVVKQK